MNIFDVDFDKLAEGLLIDSNRNMIFYIADKKSLTCHKKF